MPRTKPLQYSFAAGELAPELILRRDTTQFRDGAKSLLNGRIHVGGGCSRRPGSRWSYTLVGECRLEDWVVNESTRYIAAFSEGQVDFFTEDMAIAGQITGCPWTGGIWRTMDYAQSSNTAFLTSPGMAPQIVTRTGASSWTRAAFAFFSDYGGRTNQPYFKLAPAAMTLTPSAVSGAGITLTLSGAGHWVAGHVGQIVRYHKREILITSRTSATVAVGTVIEELPVTMALSVAFTTGFAVGQVVEGSVTGSKGVIASIGAGVLNVVLLDTKTGVFFTTADKVISPTASQTVTGLAFPVPGAVTDWDEALYTATNGYPKCVEIHRNRVIFGGHPLVPNSIQASWADNLYNFDVGSGGDAEAVFELIGDAGAAQIVQLHSAEQLLLFTDKGPYYVPETAQTPFRPTGMAFNAFGQPWPCANARTFDFDGGVIMVSGSLVVKCSPTGSQNKLWDAEEVSLLASHLINAPVDTAFTSNFAGGPERYGVLVNADGTLAVMQLIEAQKFRNFVPWDTSGLYKSVASLGGRLYACVQRVIDGTFYLLEEFDIDLTLDACRSYADVDDSIVEFGTTARHIVVGDYYLGAYPLTVEDPPAGPYEIGLQFDREIETLPPHIEDQGGVHDGEMMRILSADVHVISSARFAAQGYELAAYQVTEDPSAAPPLRSGPQRFTFLGWRREPTIVITQPDPLKLHVAGIRMEVAY